MLYTVINDLDPNDFFEVEADSYDEAEQVALEELGYCIWDVEDDAFEVVSLHDPNERSDPQPIPTDGRIVTEALNVLNWWVAKNGDDVV